MNQQDMLEVFGKIVKIFVGDIMSKQKKDEERPIISFRVNKELKNKILNVYGGYTPLEYIIEEQLLGDITPPSRITEDDKKIKELKKLKEEYVNIYDNNKKIIKKLERMNNKTKNKVNKIDEELNSLNKTKNQIKTNVQKANLINQDKINHSINTVIKLLKENQSQRELRPTRPLPKKVVKLYSDNCNMSYKKFMEYIPSDLHKCVE